MGRNNIVLEVSAGDTIIWETGVKHWDSVIKGFSKERAGKALGLIPAGKKPEEAFNFLAKEANKRKRFGSYRGDGTSGDDRLLVEIPMFGRRGESLKPYYYAIRPISVLKVIDADTGEIKGERARTENSKV